jgi:hypothetical protein
MAVRIQPLKNMKNILRNIYVIETWRPDIMTETGRIEKPSEYKI